MPTLRRSALLLAALLLTACGGPAAPGVPSGGGTGDALAMTSQPESGAAVSAVLGPEGGSVEATASDGTHYLLDVPADALLMTTTVTLTPLSAVSGVPMSGGLVGGVALSPDALTFAAPVSLTIEPPAPVDAAGLIAYAAHGDGSARLDAVDPASTGTSIVLQLRHFSDHAVGEGTAADRAEAASHTPASAEDAIAQDGAVLTDALRNGEIDHDTWVQGLIANALRWHDQVLEPALQAAEAVAPHGDPADLATLQRAASLTFGWLRELSLLGLDESSSAAPLIQDARERLAAIATAWGDAVASRCLDDHDLSVIDLMIGMERTLALLGVGPVSSPALDCLHFVLHLDSTITAVPDDPNSGWTIRVAADVPLDLDGRLRFTGEAPLAHATFTMDMPPTGSCVLSVTDGTMVVPAMDLVALPMTRADQRVLVADVALRYQLADLLESYTCYADGILVGSHPDVPVFRDDFWFLHQDEALAGVIGPDALYRASGWILGIAGDPIVATKRWQRRVTAVMPYQEDTTLRLEHTPVR